MNQQKPTKEELQNQISKLTEKRKQIEEDIKHLQQYKPKITVSKKGKESRTVKGVPKFLTKDEYAKQIKTWEKEYEKLVKKDQEFYQKIDKLYKESVQDNINRKSKKTTDIKQQSKLKEITLSKKIDDFSGNAQIIIGEWEKMAVKLDEKGINCVNTGRDFLILSRSYFALSKKYLKLVEKADSVINSIGNDVEKYNDAVRDFDLLIKRDVEYQHQAKTLDDRYIASSKVKDSRENKNIKKQQEEIAKQEERERREEIDIQVSQLEREKIQMRQEKKIILAELKNKKKQDKNKKKDAKLSSIIGSIVFSPFKAVGLDFEDEKKLLSTIFKPAGSILGKAFGKTSADKYALPEGLGDQSFAELESEIKGLRLEKRFGGKANIQKNSLGSSTATPTTMGNISEKLQQTVNNFGTSSQSSNVSTEKQTEKTREKTSEKQTERMDTFSSESLDLNRTDDENLFVEEQKRTNTLLEKLLKKEGKGGKSEGGGLFSKLGGIFGGLASVGRLLGSLGGVLGSALRGIGVLVPMLPAIAPFALGAAALGTSVWAGKKIYDTFKERSEHKSTLKQSQDNVSEVMTQKLIESGAPQEVIEKFQRLNEERGGLDASDSDDFQRLKQIDSEMVTIRRAYLKNVNNDKSEIEKIHESENQKSSVVREKIQQVNAKSIEQKTNRIQETVNNDKTTTEEFQQFLVGDFINTLVKKLADALSDKGPGISRMPGMSTF